MSVFKKQELVAAYPAFNVYKRSPKSEGFVEITTEDTLILKVDGDHKGTFSPGSVVSYALEYNECPLAAVERAKSNGHELVWINANGAMLTAHHRAAEDVVEVEYGMLVRFQGVIATIEKANNNNLKLVTIK
jgi:hypothetical protein